MSVCDERAGKMGWIEVTGAFTSGTIPAVHNRFAHFRQWHMDANDGAKLGDERAHQQSYSAWAGELRIHSPERPRFRIRGHSQMRRRDHQRFGGTDRRVKRRNIVCSTSSASSGRPVTAHAVR